MISKPHQDFPDRICRHMAEDHASRPNSKQPSLPNPTSKAGEPPHRGLVRHTNAGQNRRPDEQPLGFSAARWSGLCEHHDAEDNHPPYRDEQRAWYDTLRDLVPPHEKLHPTVRLYARDLKWCSLDPDNSDDRQRFSALLPQRRLPFSTAKVRVRAPTVRTASTVRVAMIFPRLTRNASNGVPPSGPGAQRPVVPTTTSFAGETVDFVLFPEGYISSSDAKRSAVLRRLASDLGAPLLVGAIDEGPRATDRVVRFGVAFDLRELVLGRVLLVLGRHANVRRDGHPVASIIRRLGIGGGRNEPARWPRAHLASSEPGTVSGISFILRPSRSLDAGNSDLPTRSGTPVQYCMGERVPGRKPRSQSTRT